MAATATPTSVLSVRALLRLVATGRVRIPSFQRPFVWSAEQTKPFLESVFAGLPTGPILVVRKPAPAGSVLLGPVRIDAPAVPSALWIVDGSQRLTVLAAAFLSRYVTGSSALPYAYDLETHQVTEYETGAELPAEFLPLSILADHEDFERWLTDHHTRVGEAESIRAQILDYPMVISELPDTDQAPEIFARINTGGVRLRTEEIERARGLGQPRDFEALQTRLAGLRFGRFSEQLVEESMRAVGSPHSVADAWTAHESTVAWLRGEAAVPHLDIWRQQDLLPVLVRYFARNQRPTARARILLRRWLWRAMGTTSRPRSDSFEAAITGRDSVDASNLLAQVTASPPAARGYLQSVGPELALTTLDPLSLLTAEPLAVAGILSELGREAFRTVLGEPIFSPASEGDLRAIVPAAADRAPVLASHALDRETLNLLSEANETEFRERRRGLLAEALRSSADRLAEWGASDRPGISSLVVIDEAGDDD